VIQLLQLSLPKALSATRIRVHAAVAGDDQKHQTTRPEIVIAKDQRDVDAQNALSEMKNKTSAQKSAQKTPKKVLRKRAHDHDHGDADDAVADADVRKAGTEKPLLSWRLTMIPC
jgi:hypothetical protein